MSVVKFPEVAERGEMRASLLAVEDDCAAMARVVMLAERVADIIGEIEIKGEDRYSLLWHVSLIRELAVPRSDGKIKPGCVLPRFDPPPGAA